MSTINFHIWAVSHSSQSTFMHTVLFESYYGPGRMYCFYFIEKKTDLEKGCALFKAAELTNDLFFFF